MLMNIQINIKNTTKHYGWVSIFLHWFVALTVIGLFALGYWMVDLDYYNPWNKQGPDLHKSIGMLLFFVMIFRLIWRSAQIKPKALKTHSDTEKKLGHFMHVFLYTALFILMICGYLISTADGRAIEVFQLISIMSFGELFTNQEDLAGAVHKYLAYLLMCSVVLHALAALKHHFIDKDNTLTRMLGYQRLNNQ
jgi:cytochrome b561